jgi:hypothetical protein
LRQPTYDAPASPPPPPPPATSKPATTTTTAQVRRPTVGEFILGRGLDGDAIIGDDTEPTPPRIFVASFNYSREAEGPGDHGAVVTVPAVWAPFRLMPSAPRGSLRKEVDFSGSSDGSLTPRDSDPAAAREQTDRFYVMTNPPPPEVIMSGMDK